MGDDRLGSGSPRNQDSAAREADCESLGAQARVYLSAGAWQSAHDLLWPYLQRYWDLPVLPTEAIECACLLMAACVRLNHSDHLARGCKWLNQAIEQGASLPPETSVLTVLTLAIQDAKEGRYDAARARAEGIPGQVLQQASSCTRARLALLRSQIESTAGRPEDAEHHALEAARLAASAESESLRGDALSLLAIVARMRGSLWEANALYAKASAHYWQSGNVIGHAVVLLNRAWALGLIGLLPESTQLFKESLSLVSTLDRPNTALRAHLGLGWVSTRRGNLKAARSVLLRAWRQARRLGLPREEALALEYLSKIYTLSGALKMARIAVRLFKQLAYRLAPEGDSALQVRISEALLSLSEGNIRDSMGQARGAIKHARRVGMPWEEAQAHRVLAMACLKTSRKQEAREELRKAHRLLARMGEQLERGVVEAWLEALDRPSSAQLGAQAPRGGGSEAPGIVRAHASDEAGSLAPGGAESSLGAARSSVPESDARDEEEALPEALRFWLNHPLLGPRDWLRSTRKRLGAAGAAGQKAKITRLRPASRAPRDDARPSEAEIEQAPDAHPLPVSEPKSAPSPIWAKMGLVTRTPEVLKTLRLAETYAPGMIPVLVLGETGTGKDLIAQGLHRLSGQAGCLVPVNCAAARKDLFVAELFGARRGAYTGAVEHRRGLIEEAEGGTIFFDEIADLEPEAQGFLLRFLDTGEVRPLGGTKSRLVETRVVAATCRDLPERVAAGLFRPDLYGRLAGLVLRVTPLRQRGEDLDLLVEMLWQRQGGRLEGCREIFTAKMLEALSQQRWPGNVRELKHAVERAMLFSHTHGAEAARADLLECVDSTSLPDAGKDAPAGTRPSPGGRAHGARVGEPGGPRRSPRGEWDPDLLREALEGAGGYIPEAARILGLSRSHAYRLYKQLRDDRLQEPPAEERSA